VICPSCGFDASDGQTCSLCSGRWDIWELHFSPLPLPEIRAQVAAWLSQLPAPAMFELAGDEPGLKLRLYTPADTAAGALAAWTAMTHQQTRWKRAGSGLPAGARSHVLTTQAILPDLAFTGENTDPLLSIGGQLLGKGPAALRIWIFGRDPALQERLRGLSAYSYGTEGGIDNDSPNPWALRLLLWRGLLFVGVLTAGLSAGAWAAGWLGFLAGLLGLLSGGLMVVVAAIGTLEWMRWRSIPKDALERRLNDALFQVAFSLHGIQPEELRLLAGEQAWQVLPADWPCVRAHVLPLAGTDLAALIAPPQTGEGSGLLDRAVRQDVPAPPPSRPLVEAQFRIGTSAATAESIGIDPDGHGLATGGSRTGKTSFAYALLRRLVEKGDDAPGIFLVDPHVSLADAFLAIIDELPPEQRAKAIRRLRIITPDQPEVVPLNLLAVPDFTWAGNAIVQVGRRIWDDYWGPRMQAALLGLFKLAHAWNMQHPEFRMGLLHVVFAAFKQDWRHKTAELLSPVDRIGALALDALLGQTAKEDGSGYRNNPSWITEVVSPILSKAMALELSPWLFAAMHQDSFVDMRRWVDEKAWIVLRLPAGEMGREGARLTAGVVYNVFDAAFRQVTLNNPRPFYFIIDEAQEIGAGMRLEAMLAEGAKFGARMFILVQSLSMMRQMEGLEPVVQAMLANTSTQAFFSPDPEDADLIRATLSSTVRYGAMTLDLPSLHCWLRARIGGQWQPPTLAQVEPLGRGNPARVQAVIREVIAAHPDEYASAEGWQERAVDALTQIVPAEYLAILGRKAKSPSGETRGGNPLLSPEDPFGLGNEI
jgi:hypothetical protein